MGAENLIFKGLTPKTVINVELATKGAKLIFNDGTSLFTSAKSEMPVDGDIITIYRHVGNARFAIDYTLGTLDKFTSTTPEELVLYWQDNGFFFDDLGAATVQNEDIIPLFLIDQVGPTNLANITLDGNYCIRNSPADLAAQGITGHTNGDVLKRAAGAWSFVLTPIPGVTFVFVEGDFRRKVFSDDPTPGVSPIFVLQQDPNEPFSVFALGTNLPGSVVFDGTTLVYTNAGGLTVADLHNSVSVVVSGVVPYFIEDTVNPERSGVYDLIINDTVGGTYTFRRSYSFRNNADFTDGQSFFISTNGGTVAENNYLFVLDQQFFLNTDALSIVLGKVSTAANAATTETTEFENRNVKNFGELGVPSAQPDPWTDIVTGVSTLTNVDDNVFGVIQKVNKYFANSSIVKSLKDLTAPDWLDLLNFGGVFGGIVRIKESGILVNAMFQGAGFSAANDPRPTEIRSRMGAFVSVDATHTIINLEGDTEVILDGTLGNPEVLKDDYLSQSIVLDPTPDAGVTFGALNMYVDTILVATGAIAASNNAVDDEVSIANSSGTGQTEFHTAEFGMTIFRSPNTRTLTAAELSADVVTVAMAEGRRNLTLNWPTSIIQKQGGIVRILASNIDGTITVNSDDGKTLFRKRKSIVIPIDKGQVLVFTNQSSFSNVYRVDTVEDKVQREHSGVVTMDTDSISIFNPTTIRVKDVHFVNVKKLPGKSLPDIRHCRPAQTDFVITGGGDQIIYIYGTRLGKIRFGSDAPTANAVTNETLFGLAVMDAGALSRIVFTPVTVGGSVDELATLIGEGGRKLSKGGSILTGGAVAGNKTIGIGGDPISFHRQLGRAIFENPDAPNLCETPSQATVAETGNQGAMFLVHDNVGDLVIDSIQQGALPEIDTSQFNNAGTLQTLSPNNWVILHVLQACGTHDIIIYTGTSEYSNQTDAENANETDWESVSATFDTSYIGKILCKKDTLTDAAAETANTIEYMQLNGARD